MVVDFDGGKRSAESPPTLLRCEMQFRPSFLGWTAGSFRRRLADFLETNKLIFKANMFFPLLNVLQVPIHLSTFLLSAMEVKHVMCIAKLFARGRQLSLLRFESMASSQ